MAVTLPPSRVKSVMVAPRVLPKKPTYEPPETLTPEMVLPFPLKVPEKGLDSVPIGFMVAPDEFVISFNTI